MKERKAQQRRQTLLSRLQGAVDTLVATFSPEAGMRRQLARSMYNAMESQRERLMAGAYEGAESDRLRGDKWLGSRLSAQSALETDRDSLRDRSRELYRNSNLKGVVKTNAKNVVGTGGRIQSRIKETEGIITQDEADAHNAKLDRLWAQWCQRVDVSRKRSFRQQMKLMCKHIDFDGAGLTVMSDVGSHVSPLPLCLEVIDPKRLQTPPNMTANKLVRMGVEKDSQGRIVAYHLQKQVPDDNLDVGFAFDRVDASRVIHVFEQEFAETVDGEPLFTPILNDAKDSKDTTEAAIIALQVQACHALYVTSKNRGSNAAAVGMGNGTSVGPRRQQDIQPGTITYLDGDDTITQTSPTSPGNNFAPFMDWSARRQAAGIDFPYELLTKNWSGLSFAGGRLVLADARLGWADRRELLKEMYIAPVWQRFVEEAVILGEVDIDPRVYALYPWLFWECAWLPPGWQYALNPGEEVKAAKEAVDANFRSRTDVAAEMYGNDLEDVYDAREWEKEQEEQRGIMPPTTPGAVTNAPNNQTEEAAV